VAKPHASAVERSIEAGQASLSSQTSIGVAPLVPADPATTTSPTVQVPTTTIPGATTVAPTTAAPTTAPPPTTIPAIKTIAIGDSVMLGAAPQLKQALGDSSFVDAHVGRQFKEASALIDSYAASGRLGQNVVIHLGNNGTVSSDTVDDVLDRLGNVPRVIVLTVRVNRDWQDEVNATLLARVPVHKNVVLLDWFTASANHPEYFYDDGTHLRPAGAAAYAAFIQTALG
jgi:lysophospholipase L1-like esterase